MKESIHVLETMAILAGILSFLIAACSPLKWTPPGGIIPETPGYPLLAFIRPFIRKKSLNASLSGKRDIRISYLPYDWRLNDQTLMHSPSSEGIGDG